MRIFELVRNRFLILWISILYFTISAVEAYVFHHFGQNSFTGRTGTVQKRRLHNKTMKNNNNNRISINSQLLATTDNEGRFQQQDQQSRSIGDVVQGLHGSKYQFGHAGINFEGQQFAETGYSSGDYDNNDDNMNYDDEPLPNWAIKLQQMVLDGLNKNNNYPELVIPNEIDTSSTTMVEIHNDERSWEKYYAFILNSNTETSLSSSRPFSVQPNVGMLAPRGGVNEFSDRAQLFVQKVTPTVTSDNGNWWLVIGTEADRWIYKLV